MKKEKDEVWYIMITTLQGKHSLLVAEEIYDEEEITLEGFTVEELLKNKQAKKWIKDE